MAIDYFNARWSRIFSDAGLQMTGKDKLFFPFVKRDNSYSLNIVGFQKTDPNHQGTKIAQTDNIRLNDLFRNIQDIHVYVYVPKTTRDIAAALIERYGLPLRADWFVEVPISAGQVANMPFNIDLQLLPVYWCFNDPNDKVTVTVHEPNVDLAVAFANNVIDAPGLPYKLEQGRTNVELVSIGTDFTPLYVEDYQRLREITTDADLSSAATPNVYRADVLVRLMEERTSVPTQRQSTVEAGILSTAGAKLKYHGKPAGFPTADTRYDYVLVFTVSCPTYVGDYYFHYNSLY